MRRTVQSNERATRQEVEESEVCVYLTAERRAHGAEADGTGRETHESAVTESRHPAPGVELADGKSARIQTANTTMNALDLADT